MPIIFEVEDDVDLRESQQMKMGELRKALKLARANRELILERWREYLG